MARVALSLSPHVMAPQCGGESTLVRRLQINLESAPQVFGFDAKSVDAVVLTNRMPMAAAISIGKIMAAARPVQQRYDDGGRSFTQAIDAQPMATYIGMLKFMESQDLDLIVLPHRWAR